MTKNNKKMTKKCQFWCFWVKKWQKYAKKASKTSKNQAKMTKKSPKRVKLKQKIKISCQKPSKMSNFEQKTSKNVAILIKNGSQRAKIEQKIKILCSKPSKMSHFDAKNHQKYQNRDQKQQKMIKKHAFLCQKPSKRVDFWSISGFRHIRTHAGARMRQFVTHARARVHARVGKLSIHGRKLTPPVSLLTELAPKQKKKCVFFFLRWGNFFSLHSKIFTPQNRPKIDPDPPKNVKFALWGKWHDLFMSLIGKNWHRKQ